MQPRGHHKQRSTRSIELSYATARHDPSARRVVAECAAERTVLIFLGPPILDEADPDALLAGPFGRAVVDDHRARCRTCQEWERAA